MGWENWGMSASRTVTVVHPDSQSRIHLRTLLQDRGLIVLTDHSWVDLLSDREATAPGVLLLERSLIGAEDLIEVLSRIRERWPETHIVFLPEDPSPASTALLLLHIDRLVCMKSTRDVLGVRG
jgi:DNA-binding NarL/FixJ family response regulator